MDYFVHLTNEDDLNIICILLIDTSYLLLLSYL